MSASEDEPVEIEYFDCPGCPIEGEAPPLSVIEGGGEFWHPLCFMRDQPEFEECPRRECPECGAPSPYAPADADPEVRSCWICLDTFTGDLAPPADAPTTNVEGMDERPPARCPDCGSRSWYAPTEAAPEDRLCYACMELFEAPTGVVADR